MSDNDLEQMVVYVATWLWLRCDVVQLFDTDHSR